MTHNELKNGDTKTATGLLSMARNHSAVVDRTLEKFGNHSISDYLRHLIPKPLVSWQSRVDLMDAVISYAGPLLGESIAKRAANDLDRLPFALTANHHGVDFFSQSIQGSLIFGLSALRNVSETSTVPIFSCGNIPLNNETYPRGLLLYLVDSAGPEKMPIKLPIFPDRDKRKMVSIVDGVDSAMISRAENRFSKMVREKQISDRIGESVRTILDQDYRSGPVLGVKDYSGQSMILNHRIWKRLFSIDRPVPDIIYLEIEKLAAILLQSDLAKPESLAALVMFEPKLLTTLIEKLEGVRGCWEYENLARRLRPQDPNSTGTKSCGTMFFWAVGANGGRTPLFLDSKTRTLAGVDDRGESFRMAFAPETLIRGLESNELIPSLFMSYLVISFARGIACAGGYFQCVYLPEIQAGLADALNATGFRNVAEHVRGVAASRYVSGMNAVMTVTDNGYMLPAGPAEIIAGGGLTETDLDKIAGMSVQHAHLAALFETIPDVAPDTVQNEWKTGLAIDLFRTLTEKVVIL